MMSQRNVEKVIGRLVTDEGFRRRFAEDREAMVREILDDGLDLNSCERRALLALDPQRIARFAEQLDPCIQKVELATQGRAAAERSRAEHGAWSGNHGTAEGVVAEPPPAVPDREQGDDS